MDHAESAGWPAIYTLHRAHATGMGTRTVLQSEPSPDHQVDVKFLERIAGTRRRFYPFTAIDDCPRIRVLKVSDGCNQRTAIGLIDDVLRRLPFRVLSKMSAREGATRAGLQVTLERDRAMLVTKLDQNVYAPWAAVRGVPGLALVMSQQPRREVRRHSGVVPRRLGIVSQDVDHASRRWHTAEWCKVPTTGRLSEVAGF